MNIMRYALVVGIADYESLPSLTKPIRDAEAVAQRLEKQGNFRVERLPKRWNAEKKCDEIAQERLTGQKLGQTLLHFLEIVKGSEAVIYFSGHGITVTDELGQKKGYLAASDCAIRMQGKQIFGQQHGICLDSLNTLISKANFSALAVILDCCHADYFLEASSLKENLSVFTYKPHSHLIAACRIFPNMDEGRRGWGYSPFTTALLEALQPHNANSEGNVGVEELYSLIAHKLALKNTEKNHLVSQKPIRMGLGRSVALASYSPKQTLLPILETSPYQGLKAFNCDSRSLFFGREAVIQTLRQKLELNKLVGVIGSAGSGKTSLLKAGLIPVLEANNWQVLGPISPGKEPVEALKSALAELMPATELSSICAELETLPDLDWLVKYLDKNQQNLLVIDSFEELFTLCESESQRQKFMEILTEITSISSHKFGVVVALGADFLENYLNFPCLADLLQYSLVYLTPLKEGNLEQVITLPAKLRGYELETGLLELLKNDFSQVAANLGLLQFTLTQLWDRRNLETRQFTLESYHQVGGLRNALNQYAETFYESLSPPQQDWVKKIFLKLLVFSLDFKIVRCQQPLTELLTIAGDSSEIDEIMTVLNQLIDCGLLISSNSDEQSKMIDLTGTVLIKNWQRLAEWCLKEQQKFGPK